MGLFVICKPHRVVVPFEARPRATDGDHAEQSYVAQRAAIFEVRSRHAILANGIEPVVLMMTLWDAWDRSIRHLEILHARFGNQTHIAGAVRAVHNLALIADQNRTGADDVAVFLREFFGLRNAEVTIVPD